MELINGLLKRGRGIAECNEFMVFSDKLVPFASGINTVPIAFFREAPPPSSKADTRTHYQAWLQIFNHYIWHEYDWLVKVDPQTLFFPNQFKYLLKKHQTAWMPLARGKNKGVYLETSALSPEMTGALQVISSKAIVIWSFHRENCTGLDQ